MYLYIHGTWLFLLYNIIINKMKIIMKTSYNPTKSIVETMNEARENFKKRYGRLLKETGEFVEKAKCPKCDMDMIVLDHILEGIDTQDDGTEVHECDYKDNFKDLTLDELSYIRENAVFSGILSFLFTMIEGRN